MANLTLINKILIMCFIFLSSTNAQNAKLEEQFQQQHVYYRELLWQHPVSLLVFLLVASIIVFLCSRIIKWLWTKLFAKREFVAGNWQLSDVGVLVFAYLVSQIIIPGLIPKSPIQVFVGYWAVIGSFCLIMVLWIVTLQKGPIEILGIKSWSFKKLAGAAMGYMLFIPIFFVSFVISHLLFAAIGVCPSPQTVALELTEAEGYVLLWGIATAVIAAPFFEEFLFRVFLYSMLRKAIGLYGALLLSSLIFAIIHFNAFAIIPIFMLGMLLAIMYEKTQSLYVPVLAHALHNGIALAYLRFMLADN